MKTFKILIILFALILISCEKDESKNEESVNLIGTWQLTKTTFSDGGSSSEWSNVPIEDPFLIFFNEDLSYLSQNDMISCNTGNYDTQDGILFFYPNSAACNDSKFGFIITDSEILTLIDQNDNCVELCGYRFAKYEEQ